MSDKKWRREYQATDEDGNPIGAMQVFEADTEDELIEKLVNANMNATRRINKFTKQEKLLQAVNSDSQQPTAKPRELSADEIFELSNDLIDPDRRGAAIKRIAAAAVGEAPEIIQARIQKMQGDVELAEVRVFIASHPDYVICKPNSEALMGYLEKYRMAVTEENLSLAFDTLKEAELLQLKGQEAPEVENEDEEPVAESSRIAPQPVVTRPRNAATGLRPGQSSVTGSKVKAKTITYEDIAQMSSAEYNRRLANDPEFRRIVDSMGR